MKHIILFITVALSFLACNVPEQSKEDIPADKMDLIEELSKTDSLTTNNSVQSKLLLKASCTEPFLYAEFYNDKALFTFPEKDTIVLIHGFDSILTSSHFEYERTIDQHKIKIDIFKHDCIHPGSGEKWNREAKFTINGQKFIGCAKTVE